MFGRKTDKDTTDQIHLVSGQPRAAGNLLAVEQAALAQAALRRSEPLPPPLRRGSGQRISTALSIPPSGRTAKNPIPTPKGPPKPRNVRRKEVASEDTDSDDYDAIRPSPRKVRSTFCQP